MGCNSQQNWFCSCFIHFRVLFGDQFFCFLFMHGMFFLIPYSAGSESKVLIMTASLVFPMDNPKIPPSHPPVRHWRIRPHLLKHWRLGGPKRLSRGILHPRLFHPFPLSVAPRSSRDFKATILRRTAIIRGLQRPNMPFFKSWHLSQLEAVISFFEETWWYLHFYISGTSWSNGLQDDFCTLLTSLPSLYSIRNQDPKTIRPWRKLRCLTKKNLQKNVPLKSCSRRPAAKRTRREPGHFFLLGTDLKQSDHRRGGKQLLKLQRHSAQFGFKSEGADVK